MLEAFLGSIANLRISNKLLVTAKLASLMHCQPNHFIGRHLYLKSMGIF